jgi:hypothetical protein
MSSGLGPREAQQAYVAEHERLHAERDSLLRTDRLRSAPGYGDLVVLGCVVLGALVAAVWLVGTRPTDGRLNAALLVGGLLGSGSAALVSVGRPSAWWPLPGARWIWRGVALSGPVAALAVAVLVDGWFQHALLPTLTDRLLIGFAAGAAASRLMRAPKGVAVPTPRSRT